MYFFPKDSTRNYTQRPNKELFESFKAQVIWFDDTKYLYDKTHKICDKILQDTSIIYDSKTVVLGINELYVKTYELLKEELYAYELSGKGKVRALKTLYGSSVLIKAMTEQVLRITSNLEEEVQVHTSSQEEEPLGEEEECKDDSDDDTEEEKERDRDNRVYYKPTDILDLK